MVSNLIKSKKVFLALILLFFLTSFIVVFLSRGTVINEMGLYRFFSIIPLYLKIPIIVTASLLFITGLQTFLCSLFSFKKISLRNIVHISGGLTVVLCILFLFLPVYQFRGFPEGVVREGDIKIKVENVSVNPQTMSVTARISIEKNKKIVEGTTSFNNPLITKDGVVWISGVDSNGIIFKYQPFSILPFVTLLCAVCFVISLSIQTVKTFLRK
ncbi:hypothetical protein [Desulfurobacterium sp.]